MLRIVSVIENSTIFASNNAFDKILTSTYYVTIYASQDTTYKEAGAKCRICWASVMSSFELSTGMHIVWKGQRPIFRASRTMMVIL